MKKRFLLKAVVLGALMASSAVMAQDKFKIGLILPMTGPFASTGKQIEAAAKLYIAQNGDMVAGKKVELIVKDDTSAPDVTKRIAQELVVNDKVSVLAGFGLTPLALATAPDIANTVRVLPLPGDLHAPLHHRMVLLKGASAAAVDWQRFLLSPQAQAVFVRHGYGLPQ